MKSADVKRVKPNRTRIHFNLRILKRFKRLFESQTPVFLAMRLLVQQTKEYVYCWSTIVSHSSPSQLRLMQNNGNLNHVANVMKTRHKLWNRWTQYVQFVHRRLSYQYQVCSWYMHRSTEPIQSSHAHDQPAGWRRRGEMVQTIRDTTGSSRS